MKLYENQKFNIHIVVIDRIINGQNTFTPSY
jgi:hypothetical protein